MVEKKHVGIGLVVAIIVVIVILFVGGYIVIKRPVLFKNEREVSSAITNVSEDIQDVSSTLAEIEKSLTLFLEYCYLF